MELAGIAAFITGFSLGIINTAVVLLFVVVAIGYATVLSIVGVVIEELSCHRYHAWRDFGLLADAAIAENIGYRQLYDRWRLHGMADALAGRRAKWVATQGAAPARQDAPAAG